MTCLQSCHENLDKRHLFEQNASLNDLATRPKNTFMSGKLLLEILAANFVREAKVIGFHKILYENFF